MPELAIDNQLRGIREAEIAKNRTIIKHIASAVHLCGTQSIALCGHRDDSTANSGSNKRNFLAILNYSIKSMGTLYLLLIPMKLPKMQFTLEKPFDPH